MGGSYLAGHLNIPLSWISPGIASMVVYAAVALPAATTLQELC